MVIGEPGVRHHITVESFDLHITQRPVLIVVLAFEPERKLPSYKAPSTIAPNQIRRVNVLDLSSRIVLDGGNDLFAIIVERDQLASVLDFDVEISEAFAHNTLGFELWNDQERRIGNSGAWCKLRDHDGSHRLFIRVETNTSATGAVSSDFFHNAEVIKDLKGAGLDAFAA
jgi:hypothetical protein